MAKPGVRDLVQELLTPFLEEQGLELYHVEFLKEGKDWFLRIYIDKLWELEEAFVSTEDCEKVSRYLSGQLDLMDPIEQNYYLEVSSPGMDRALHREKDYRRYQGREVEVRLYEPIAGQKKYEGVLVGLMESQLILEGSNGQRITLPFDKVAKTILKVVF